jgi:hypothetical protein
MDEDNRNSEEFKIEISRFNNNGKINDKTNNNMNSKVDKVNNDNTMQIYIQSKSNRKLISVNVNDESDKENIQIKIEKDNKRKRVEDSGAKGEDAGPSIKAERRDVFGKLISKGKPKEYKVTFLDMNQTKNNLPNFPKSKQKSKFKEIVDVESFKFYNSDITEKRAHTKTDCNDCSCMIL